MRPNEPPRESPGESTPAERFLVRQAVPGDVEAVARIWTVGWADGHLGHVPPELLPQRTEAQFLPRARARLASMWVAVARDSREAEGEVVGFVVVKRDEVEQLFVDRASRGTGVADELLRRAEAELRRAGYQRAWLAVVAGNGHARSFYARLGWLDAGPVSYLAETEGGPLAIQTHRYERDL